MAWPSAMRSRSQRRAVLVGQQHQLAVGGGAGGPPRLDQQHQGEQPHDLGFVGHQLGQDPAQADGLGAQLLADQGVAGAGRVALVEDQVDDGQHGPEPVREVGLVRDPVGDPGVADLALGPDQPLGHGRLGHQEGAGDLGGGEPAQQPQGQRHLGPGAEGGVAAGEDQPQPVVAHGALLGRFAPGVQQGRLGVAVLAGRLPAEPVDGPVAGGGDDPSGRARRQPRWTATAARRRRTRPGPPPRRRRCRRRRRTSTATARPYCSRKTSSISEVGMAATPSRLSPRLRPGTAAPRSAGWSPGRACGPIRARRPGRGP